MINIKTINQKKILENNIEKIRPGNEVEANQFKYRYPTGVFSCIKDSFDMEGHPVEPYCKKYFDLYRNEYIDGEMPDKPCGETCNQTFSCALIEDNCETIQNNHNCPF